MARTIQETRTKRPVLVVISDELSYILPADPEIGPPAIHRVSWDDCYDALRFYIHEDQDSVFSKMARLAACPN